MTNGIPHSVRKILMNFARLVHVYFRHLTAKFWPNWCRQCWNMISFSSLYPPKTLNAIISKVHFSKFAHYMLVFQVLSSNMPCILLEMLIWMPTTQFCGKLKLHFSDIGNLFLEHVKYIYISILTLRIYNQGPPKRKMWPPPPLPSEVEGVTIVVISF